MERYDTKEWSELVEIQNMNTDTDILTITGFMKEEQFKAHVQAMKERYAD